MKTNSIKRIVAMMMCLTIIASVMMSAAYAAEPRYDDIATADCHIYISNSVATCKVKAISEGEINVYHITMVLYQDDDDYATWNYTGTSVINRTETCYVTSGHEYYVGVHIRVYDPAGNFIEQVIGYTDGVY